MKNANIRKNNFMSSKDLAVLSWKRPIDKEVVDLVEIDLIDEKECDIYHRFWVHFSHDENVTIFGIKINNTDNGKNESIDTTTLSDLQRADLISWGKEFLELHTDEIFNYRTLKIYKCNTEYTDIPEWCFATSKKEACKLFDEFWDDGEIMEELYINPFFEKNPGTDLDDFITSFVVEEPEDAIITYPNFYEDGSSETRTVKEWLEYGTEERCIKGAEYLCHGEWN